MTSSIKPPGGPASPIGTDAASGPKATEPVRESFREAMDASAEAAPAQPASPLSPTEAVANDLAAGRVDRASAIDALVAQALAGPEASLLAPAGRVELGAHLRSALMDDPGLSGLLDDLERSA